MPHRQSPGFLQCLRIPALLVAFLFSTRALAQEPPDPSPTQSLPQFRAEPGWFEVTITPATGALPVLDSDITRPSLTSDQARAAGAFAAAVLRGLSEPGTSTLPPAFAHAPAVVYVAARHHGQRLHQVWRRESRGDLALKAALQSLTNHLGPDPTRTLTHLEINLAHSFLPVDPQDSRRLAPVQRGRLGLELIASGRRWRLAPTEMIAQNLSFPLALERLIQRSGHSVSPTNTAARIRTFDADQLLVDLQPSSPTTTLMFRGNTLEPIDSINLDRLRHLADAQSTWMWNNLQPDGRMVYLYWPSPGEESSANNEIRQWMATIALGRLARHTQDPLHHARQTSNILHNLNRSYREDDAGHGEIIENGTTVKLGALALACLALVEHPQRHQFARQESALLRTIDALWQDTGEFRTFWRPAHRTDQVNFYPGEALLLWATLHQQSRDPALRERLLRSIRFYREWHRQNRNPALIPWHTQATFRLHQTHPTEELRDWIFEMNDWLLGVQQWDEQRAFPDTMGRFHDPRRPFGPPHASSTGVYMEGLVDAWRLARAKGDTDRQDRYRRALRRAARSLAQNTFLDDVDLFYISRRERAYGGVRTTVYDNTIRVDNVQHGLMALMGILEHFQPHELTGHPFPQDVADPHSPTPNLQTTSPPFRGLPWRPASDN